MGTISGYNLKCKNCGSNLDEVNFFINRLNPINFDYLIKYCPICNQKYFSHCNEFFTVTKKDLYLSLFSSMITWIFLILVLYITFLSCFNKQFLITTIFLVILLIFIPIYYISFKYRWNNAITKSKKRLNEEEYLYNLYISNIFDMDTIISLKNMEIVSQNTFDDFLYNISNSYLINK